MPEKIDKISLKEAVKAATILTRKRAFKFWLLSHLLMKKEARDYIFMLHTYLRWADDFIDTSNYSLVEKELFVKNLYILKNKILLHKSDFTTIEEYYLFYIIKFAEEKNQPLILTCIDQYHELFEMEARRLKHDGIYSKSEFERYVILNITSLMPVFHLFLYYDSSDPVNYGVIGRFFLYVRLLKDFEEDIKTGYINICREDIKKFDINVNDVLEDPKRCLWAKSFSNDIFKALYDELEVMRRAPLKVKLFWTLGYIYLTKELLGFANYDFQIGSRIDRKFIKEYKILHSTILMSYKIIRKVFI